MERIEREEELYLEYQNRVRSSEQCMEEWERKWKKFTCRKEKSQEGIRADQMLVDQLVASWGNSAESNEILCMLEESIGEERSEIRREEQSLAEERTCILEEQDRYEEEYHKERLKIQEEKQWE